MKFSSLKFFQKIACLLLLLAMTDLSHAESETKSPWWNKDWTQRSSITIDTNSSNISASDISGATTVLVRLHDGNFQFASAREDGSDIRFVAADGKTILAHQIEKYDSLLNEAYIWVNITDFKSASAGGCYVYYSNSTDPIAETVKSSDAYAKDSTLVYHFAEMGVAPVDATTNGNNAETTANTSEGSIIGNGLRLLGDAAISIPSKPSIQWQANQNFSLAVWVKPTAAQANAVVINREEGGSAVRLLLDQLVPCVEIVNGSAPVRSSNAVPIVAGTWTHLVLVGDAQGIQLFVNGDSYSKVSTALPVLNSPITIGGLSSGAATSKTSAYVGEIDELTISNTNKSNAWAKLSYLNQGGTEAGQRLFSLGEVEGGEAKSEGGMMEHLSLFGDIAKNMMFDGWIAIGVCCIMIIVGWTVAVKKFVYLNSIEKGTNLFLDRWKDLATDLTALDTEDHQSVASLGGQVEESQKILIQKSPLYHIYQIGSHEIRNRLDKNNNRVQGLSGRSIQAIRASLDAGLVHETHRLSNGLVYLTMSIAGGPYVGLLGTVVGVMITFAIIAKSGEVNVNSIAPGIASALLATVVGLVVAIPALFIYSYLNGRIKNSLGIMQVFIDEFVAKMAEFYRPPQEVEVQEGKSTH